MSTSETRANDPFSVALTTADIHTCAFPDGNYGYGVIVEPAEGGRWRLKPAPEPEERKARRQVRGEKIAARREKRKGSKDVFRLRAESEAHNEEQLQKLRPRGDA